MGGGELEEVFVSKTLNEKQKLKWKDILVFILCYSAYAAAYLCRANFAIALPKMISEASLSRTILGSIGGAFFWTYAIGQLVNGILGDIVPPKILVGLGLLLSASCNLFIFFFPSVTFLTVFWIINGFALAALWGPIIRTVSLWYNKEVQHKVALYLNTSMVMGYFLAWGGLGKLLGNNSWRIAFLVPGIVGLLVAFLWVLLLPKEITEASRKEKEGREVTPKAKKKGETALNLGVITIFLIIISSVTQGIIKDGISLWGPTILVEYAYFSTELASRGALLIPLASLLGMFLAAIGDRLTKSDDSLAFSFLLILSGVSWGAVRFGTNLSGLAIAILISLAGAFAYGANTVLLTFIPLRLSKTGRVSSIAGILDFLSYVGSAIAGPLAGYLAESGSWSSALSMWLVLAILGAVASMGMRRTLRGTQKNSRQSEFVNMK